MNPKKQGLQKAQKQELLLCNKGGVWRYATGINIVA